MFDQYVIPTNKVMTLVHPVRATTGPTGCKKRR